MTNETAPRLPTTCNASNKNARNKKGKVVAEGKLWMPKNREKGIWREGEEA
jgi:hypothetical protein